MKYEIEIDLGPLADEWEPVAFRIPIRGEQYVSQSGCVGLFEHGVFTAPRLIVRRRWIWPEWLTAEWYCEGRDGKQYTSTFEPLQCSGIDASGWLGNGTMRDVTGIIALQRIGGDWRQSKRRNPRAT